MLESNCDELHTYYSKELDDKMRQAIDRERKKHEAELNVAAQNSESEIVKVKLEREKVLQTLTDELNVLRKTVTEKEHEIARRDEELEHQKEAYRVSLLEKQNELLKVKAEVRETCHSELSKMRDSMQKDVDSEKTKQVVIIAEYRSRLDKAQRRLDDFEQTQRALLAQHCDLLRGVVEELNTNCQLLAQAVGVSPRLTSVDDVELANNNKAVMKTALVRCLRLCAFVLSSDFRCCFSQLARVQTAIVSRFTLFLSLHSNQL